MKLRPLFFPITTATEGPVIESLFEIGVAQSSLQVRKIVSWSLFLDHYEFILLTYCIPSLIITPRLATHSLNSIRLLFVN